MSPLSIFAINLKYNHQYGIIHRVYMSDLNELMDYFKKTWEERLCQKDIIFLCKQVKTKLSQINHILKNQQLCKK